MNKFEEKTIETKEIFSGRMIDVQVDQVELPNKERSYREIVRHSGAVAVIPITSEGKIVFVEQYRKPIEKSILEVPAGLIDPGEDPMDTAIRELEEETGYTTDEITFLTSVYSSPGYTDEILYIYIAKNLKKASSDRKLDDDEFVEVFEYELDELDHLITLEKIHDLKTFYAIQYLKLEKGVKGQ